MYIIGVDDNRTIAAALGRMLSSIDPDGEHRIYTDPMKAIDELDKPVEVAFLETEMPGMNGIELAKRIKERYPLCNIIFLTERSEYMASAFAIHASDYILKPYSQKKIEEALLHRRYRTPDMSDRPVKVQCFGNFEVFVKNKPVKFKRQKSKELLAYLIDRRGALCTMDMIIGNIEPDMPADDTARSMIRVYLGDLIFSFFRLGVEDLIIKYTGAFGINPAKLDCDYFRFLSGDPYAISKYCGEYMTQYGFADETRAFFEMKYYGNRDGL